MVKWLITLFVALFVLSLVAPRLSRYGFGRLPGDLRFRFAGRDWHVPFTSTILLSLVAMGVAMLL